MRRLLLSVATVIMAGSLALIGACSEGVFTGKPDQNEAPEIWLSSGPVEGDTTGYQVHFYWSGWDPDGEIEYFEFVVVEGDPYGFSPADTAGLDKWTRTSVHDSTFRVPADGNPRPWEVNELYTRYDKTHTFFIRAVDLEGKRSEPADRSFTAWTLAPTALIDRPVGDVRTYSTVITFGWTATDPIDSPSNVQDPDSIRYLYTQILNKEGIYDPYFAIIPDLNENPEDYEHLWGPWIHYRAPGDSGRETILGDDEILEINRSYIFAVQAKDDAGAVTAIFSGTRNARKFGVSPATGPLLNVNEPFLGGFQFIGTNMNYVAKDLPPGVELNFRWSATADHYGGEIQSYRYGWDIQQLDDPSQWAVTASPYIKTAAPQTFYSGVHRFLVEVVDNGQRITYGKVEVTIVPFSMERNLLWIDDWGLGAPIANKMLPGEAELDTFWVNICSRAVEFYPTRDVYDVMSANATPPDIRRIGLYANIIWTFSPSTTTAWRKIVVFTPESQIGQSAQLTVNYIALFIAKGGHVLTEGRADRAGGLYDAFITAPLLPASFKFDMATYDGEDTSGVNSMPYRDYCASVVDKISGQFHIGDDLPQGILRSLSRDAMSYMYKETNDANPGAIARYPNFPDRLDLDPSVTCTTCYFRPPSGLFTYVEIYDPTYWLDFKLIPSSQGCFHPMYRMRTISTLSGLDMQAAALIITKYREKFEQDIAEGRPVDILPANSFHFGFPLWFFDRTKVNTIMDEIFREWEILDE
jgi:hypothetical protein